MPIPKIQYRHAKSRKLALVFYFSWLASLLSGDMVWQFIELIQFWLFNACRHQIFLTDYALRPILICCLAANHLLGNTFIDLIEQKCYSKDGLHRKAGEPWGCTWAVGAAYAGWHLQPLEFLFIFFQWKKKIQLISYVAFVFRIFGEAKIWKPSRRGDVYPKINLLFIKIL